MTVRKNNGIKATQYIARLARRDFCSLVKEHLNSMKNISPFFYHYLVNYYLSDNSSVKEMEGHRSRE